jgi:hypothetical protein
MWGNGSTYIELGNCREIIIEHGCMDYITNCTEGTNDWLYPWTDIYIVATGSATSPGSALIDRSGAPNPVQGVMLGGCFMYETLGYTEPCGNVDAGTYDVVYDECQEGKMGTEDGLFQPALKVWGVGAIDDVIGDSKINADQQARDWSEVKRGTQALFLIEATYGYVSGIFNPIGFLVSQVYSEFVGASEIKDGVIQTLGQQVRHYEALAADPPDPDFQHLSFLSPVEHHDPLSNDDLLNAQFDVGDACSTESALAEVLVRAIERYQGADQDGDGDVRWALIHARAVQDFSDHLADQLDAGTTALSALRDVLEADTRDLDGFAQDMEIWRQQVEDTGFSEEEYRTLRNLDYSDSEIDDLRGFFAGQDYTFSKQGYIDHITATISTNSSSATEYRQMAEDMQDLIDLARDNPGVQHEHPVSEAGGPYTVDEGALVQLDGTGSWDPNGAIVSWDWDLNRDGIFDDATGATPAVTFDRAFQGLIGLRVTDDTDRKGVGYARITVNEMNLRPIIDSYSPVDLMPEVLLGETLPFSVITSDPDSDPVTENWSVDGVATGVGDSYDYMPSEREEVGLHTVVVRATDEHPSGGEVERDWIVSTLMDDADGDLWRANVDCREDDPSIHPGQPEICDNAEDDDCDNYSDSLDQECACATLDLRFGTAPPDKSSISWNPPLNDSCIGVFDLSRGGLSALRSSGGFGDASCLEDNDTNTEAVDSEIPAQGDGFWYVSRVDDETWNPGSPGVHGHRDDTLTVCP